MFVLLIPARALSVSGLRRGAGQNMYRGVVAVAG